MDDLIIRDVSEEIVKELNRRAGLNGTSVEAEHRKLLENVLMKPVKKSFADVLSEMPNLGCDEDFERI